MKTIRQYGFSDRNGDWAARSWKACWALGRTIQLIHNGHLIIAEQVREKLGLDEIWFMPDYEPPHVDKKRAIDSRYRLAMPV